MVLVRAHAPVREQLGHLLPHALQCTPLMGTLYGPSEGYNVPV